MPRHKNSRKRGKRGKRKKKVPDLTELQKLKLMNKIITHGFKFDNSFIENEKIVPQKFNADDDRVRRRFFTVEAFQKHLDHGNEPCECSGIGILQP